MTRAGFADGNLVAFRQSGFDLLVDLPDGAVFNRDNYLAHAAFLCDPMPQVLVMLGPS
jgi:hypothetical protein